MMCPVCVIYVSKTATFDMKKQINIASLERTCASYVTDEIEDSDTNAYERRRGIAERPPHS
jgi:hypothetical protein